MEQGGSLHRGFHFKSIRRRRKASAPQVDVGEIDEFARAGIEPSLHYQHPEMIDLVSSCLRWHREFLARSHDIHQRRAVVGERRRQRILQLAGLSTRTPNSPAARAIAAKSGLSRSVP